LIEVQYNEVVGLCSARDVQTALHREGEGLVNLIIAASCRQLYIITSACVSITKNRWQYNAVPQAQPGAMLQAFSLHATM
jgi:hypothetical protein